DPTLAAANLVGAQASAMQSAANNAGGAAVGFMGMNMAANAGGMNAQTLYQMGAQQPQAPVQQSAPAQSPAAGWTCSCGASGNTGKFCAECGSPKPADAGKWTCSCGAENSGKFCAECGKPKPAAKCSGCGWTPEDLSNPPKFCPECGKPFGA
ncbi:MAG: SPFH domain-containing protein, partial [Oscillospiraceae bacterium]|nr:SPFH domain-containing protein [Oscillospiraceae bacterium]